jgi:hydrogenase maturation protease
LSGDAIRAIADAVLYEGYILWPYRRSALKNQRRFTFGGIYPPAHSEAHPDDPAAAKAQVLISGPPETEVQVTARFLQVVRRQAVHLRNGELEHVDELIIDGQRYSSWEEAVEREVRIGGRLGELGAGRRMSIRFPAGSEREELGDGGTFIRSWHELRGELMVCADEVALDLWRVSASIRNTTPMERASRQRALEHSFCSSHLLLNASGGEFVSMIDPPAEVAAEAARCENVGLWPVLVGEGGSRQAMLCSPIILEDHPRVAPESPGDLFDGGEIDQLLILNILALTDEEKAEVVASDPRAREILERSEALTPDQLMALHGTIREFGMAR